MDETSQHRGLAELRALLRTHGPAQVFGAIGEICAEEAKRRADEDDVELWEVAADSAHDAAEALSDEGEEDEPGDTEDEASCDSDESSDLDDESEDAPDVASVASVGDEDDEPDEDDVEPDEELEATPEPALTAEQPARRPRHDEGTTVMKDPHLGDRPKKASYWRCVRLENGKRQPLFHGENGFEVSEWPIRMCTAETIAERWGDGDYIAYYIMIDESGRRRPHGRSRVLHVTGRSRPQGADEEAPAIGATTAIPKAMPAAMPPMVGAPSGAPMDPWAMITYIRDAEERAQARADAKARLEIERLRVEAQDREARRRTELEMQMERERLQTQERIAQIEMQGRMARGGTRMDAELAAQLGQVVKHVSNVEARVEEALAEFEAGVDEREPRTVEQAPPPPPDPITRVIEVFGPIVETLMSRFADPSKIPIPSISLPPSDPSDPSKKPN